MASAKTLSHCRLSLQVVINGGATSSGEQDNEDTELMAIYTTENGIAEKVPMLAPSSCPVLFLESWGALWFGTSYLPREGECGDVCMFIL